jgi:hypothetical protein
VEVFNGAVVDEQAGDIDEGPKGLAGFYYNFIPVGLKYFAGVTGVLFGLNISGGAFGCLHTLPAFHIPLFDGVIGRSGKDFFTVSAGEIKGQTRLFLD